MTTEELRKELSTARSAGEIELKNRLSEIYMKYSKEQLAETLADITIIHLGLHNLFVAQKVNDTIGESQNPQPLQKSYVQHMPESPF